MIYQNPHIFYKIRRGRKTFVPFTTRRVVRTGRSGSGNTLLFFSRPSDEKKMRCCGTVCRNGTICRKPVGHAGHCEIFEGKRKRPQEVLEAITRMRQRTESLADYTFQNAEVRIGCNYQAVVPDWEDASDKTRPVETYSRADTRIDSATVEDCVS